MQLWIRLNEEGSTPIKLSSLLLGAYLNVGRYYTPPAGNKMKVPNVADLSIALRPQGSMRGENLVCTLRRGLPRSNISKPAVRIMSPLTSTSRVLVWCWVGVSLDAGWMLVGWPSGGLSHTGLGPFFARERGSECQLP